MKQKGPSSPEGSSRSLKSQSSSISVVSEHKDVPQWTFGDHEDVSGRAFRRQSSLRSMRSWCRINSWLDHLSIGLTTFLGCIAVGRDAAWYHILVGSFLTAFGGGILMSVMMSLFERSTPQFPFSKDDLLHHLIWIFAVLCFTLGFTADELKHLTGSQFFTFLIAVNSAILVSFGSHACFALRTNHWYLAPLLVYVYVHGGGDLRNLLYKGEPGVHPTKFMAYDKCEALIPLQVAIFASGFIETQCNGASKKPLLVAFFIYLAYLKQDALWTLAQTYISAPAAGSGSAGGSGAAGDL